MELPHYTEIGSFLTLSRKLTVYEITAGKQLRDGHSVARLLLGKNGFKVYNGHNNFVKYNI